METHTFRLIPPKSQERVRQFASVRFPDRVKHPVFGNVLALACRTDLTRQAKLKVVGASWQHVLRVMIEQVEEEQRVLDLPIVRGHR
jgi:hypothetical protein